MLFDITGIQPCLRHRFTGGDVSIFGLLGHISALTAAEYPFQFGNFEMPRQRRTKSHFLTDRIIDYS